MISKTFIFAVLFTITLSNPIKFMHMTKESGDTQTPKTEHFIIADLTVYELSNLNQRNIQITSDNVPILEANLNQEIQDSPAYIINVDITQFGGSLIVSDDEVCNITITGDDVGGMAARSVDHSWREAVSMVNNTVSTFQNIMIFKSEVSSDGTEVSFKFESFSSELSVAVTNAVCLKYVFTDNRKMNFI